MTQPAIRMERLTKRYRIGERAPYRTLRGVLNRALAPPFLRRRPARAEAEDYVWAVNDVTFDVEQGEVLGLIGRNGAGKSTLLKLIARITEPTSGHAEVRGVLGALLEVGTGFHLELTGRENIYLNGAILGMRRAAINRRFDEIVDFSGVERFLDTPVKHYSSGMFLRLAFSVAAHLEPDILVVDEVLAVGDAEFQRKCLGKVHDVSSEGRTVLLVSHNLAAVTGLCSRTVWLDQGGVAAIGETEDVVRRYLAASEAGAGGDLAERRDREGTGRLRFTAFRVESADGAPVQAVMSGDSVRLVAEYAAEPGIRDVTARFQLTNSLGHVVLTFWTEAAGQRFEAPPERGRIIAEAPRLPLLADHYTVTLWAGVQGHTADQIDAGYIDVADGDFYGTGKSMQGHRHGVFQVEHSWRIE